MSSRRHPAAEGLHKPRQDPSCLVVKVFEFLHLLFRKVAEAMRQLDVITELTQGTKGDVQEVDVFFQASSGTAFNDIGCHGDRRSSHLGSQSEHFFFREDSGSSIDCSNQFFCERKCFQLSMVPHNVYSSMGNIYQTQAPSLKPQAPSLLFSALDTLPPKPII